MERTTPPSTRNAAPLVADDNGLATIVTIAVTSSEVANRCNSDVARAVRKKSCSTNSRVVPWCLARLLIGKPRRNVLHDGADHASIHPQCRAIGRRRQRTRDKCDHRSHLFGSRESLQQRRGPRGTEEVLFDQFARGALVPSEVANRKAAAQRLTRWSGPRLHPPAMPRHWSPTTTDSRQM